MFQGFRCDTEGQFHGFQFNTPEWENDNMDIHAENRGEGDYVFIEQFESNGQYLVFGWTRGNQFNTFDLDTCNTYGDIMFIKVDRRLNPLEATYDEIRFNYEEVELEQLELQDDFDNLLNDEEYDSSFVCEEIEYMSDYDEEDDISLQYFQS